MKCAALPGASPIPEKRGPTNARNVRRADRQIVGLASPRQADRYHNRHALLKRHADAHNLSVYDGQKLCGFIIALPYPGQSWAFDRRERCLGTYPSRKLAATAVGAAYDGEQTEKQWKREAYHRRRLQKAEGRHA